ncbi:thioredoxin family protein [Nocardia brasiliensis]|uniref:thioredoxin family protein n=1 Tax=Nocardia brasiliensis TaxID=37326 RepID=UPI003D8E4775
MTGDLKETITSSFDRDVLQSSAPTLVFFWADWHVRALQTTPTIVELAEQYAGRVEAFGVDIDQERTLRERYGAREVPTTILFNRGSEVGRAEGFITLGQLTDLVQANL